MISRVLAVVWMLIVVGMVGTLIHRRTLCPVSVFLGAGAVVATFVGIGVGFG